LRSQRPAWRKLGLIALVLLALAAAWRFTPLAALLTPQRVMAFARAVGGTAWAPFALMAAYTPAAFVLFPRPLLTLLAMVAFGLVLGCLYAAVGVVAAALATYCVGRWLPDKTVRRLAGTRFERATGVLRRHGILAIFAGNMLPTPPFVVQGILAGAARIKLWHYIAGTLLSLVPGLIAAMIFGHQIIAALEDASRVSYPLLGATAVGLIVVTALAARWLSRQASHAA
jgi:uncharacterized membrane protein YdjX (TVP38/TMEM64 family)